MKKPDYLRVLCSDSYKEEMEKAIAVSGYSIIPNFPLSHSDASGNIVMWIFVLDVIYNKTNPTQQELLKLQDKSLGFEGAI